MSALDGLNRLWCGADAEVGAIRLFRRVFDMAEDSGVAQATLALFAESHYHLWVNGRHIGRGPTACHPHRRPVAVCDLKPALCSGRNVLAVLVYAANIPLHNHIPSGAPGLVARLDIRWANGRHDVILPTSDWKVMERSGWQQDVPRRGWALGFVECYDAAQAPVNWQTLEFDDSGWLAADCRPVQTARAFPIDYIEPGLPPVRFVWQSARSLLGRYAVGAVPPSLSRDMESNAYGAALLQEPWRADIGYRLRFSADDPAAALAVEGMTTEEGVVICLDMEKEYVGAVSFDMTCDSPGIIDIGWAETLECGRPQVVRKHCTYADRYIARCGANHWLPIGFSGGRYLLLVLRGFSGLVTFQRIGMAASEPDLNWHGAFACDRPRLNAIWELCERTVRVGTQESLMDCPTREQATYVGDGNPTARWVGRLTGNYAHWRHLIRETFAVQNADGQIKSAIFSGQRYVLVDYSLLAIIGARDYARETGDTGLGSEILPACGRLLDWYAARCNSEGLFAWEWEDMPRRASWVTAPACVENVFCGTGYDLFVDHPGLGWHNRHEPGIDRRGVNAAINALWVLALRAGAELADTCGAFDGVDWRKRADELALRLRSAFWNEAEGVFADGRYGEILSRQISQQTNVWCLAAGTCGREQARTVLRRILLSDDAAMARCGPYFWCYLFPLMMEHDLGAEALSVLEREWGGMLEGGATTAWETFTGDELDSWCHPWSAAPADFLLGHVAGIGVLPSGQTTIELKPQIRLLRSVKARSVTARGPVTVGWEWDGAHCRCFGRLPSGVMGRLRLPGYDNISVYDQWTQRPLNYALKNT